MDWWDPVLSGIISLRLEGHASGDYLGDLDVFLDLVAESLWAVIVVGITATIYCCCCRQQAADGQ